MSDPSKVLIDAESTNENDDEAGGENTLKQETDSDNKIDSEHDNIDENKESENVKDLDSAVENIQEKCEGIIHSNLRGKFDDSNPRS